MNYKTTHSINFDIFPEFHFIFISLHEFNYLSFLIVDFIKTIISPLLITNFFKWVVNRVLFISSSNNSRNGAECPLSAKICVVESQFPGRNILVNFFCPQPFNWFQLLQCFLFLILDSLSCSFGDHFFHFVNSGSFTQCFIEKINMDLILSLWLSKILLELFYE